MHKTTYKQYIEKLKEKYIGSHVIYNGEMHTIIDVDYNGALLIDLPQTYTKTTAISFGILQEAKKEDLKP